MMGRNIRNWLHDRRGSASIECVLGTVVMVSASLIALELYRQVNTQVRVSYAAIALAEYASQEADTPALFIDRLAEFLHTEQFNPANAAFIVSAVRQDAVTPTLLWSREALFGPQAAARLAGCSRITQGGVATLPAELALTPGEVVIIAETCVEQVSATSARVLYSYYIMPSYANRDPNLIL